jgi:hypothetical protein
MRLRSALTTAAATAALVVVPFAPGHAGTGTANWCGDNIHGGGMDVPVLTYPITVGVEIFYPATSTGVQQLRICFSDTPPGQPSRVLGGEIAVGVWTNTGTVDPGASVRLECIPDLGPTGLWPTCNTPVGANVAVNEVTVTTPNSSLCLVSLGGGCQLYLPGVKVVTNGDPSRPLLSLNILGTPLSVSVPPPNCLAIIVTCP